MNYLTYFFIVSKLKIYLNLLLAMFYYTAYFINHARHDIEWIF
jgi:hypothetical protein